MLVDGGQELIAGARLRDDSEAGFLQQAGDALSEEQRVVGEDEPSVTRRPQVPGCSLPRARPWG